MITSRYLKKASVVELAKLPKSYYLFYYFVHWCGYLYVQPVDEDVATMGFDGYMYRVFKYWVRPIVRAERGKGIEKHFAGQDFSFDYGDDFVEKSSFTISAGGDLLPSQHISPDNTAHLWDEVGDFYFDADLATANLESPFSETSPPGYLPRLLLENPVLNSRRDIFERFVAGGRGIGFFSTANNHSLDAGEEGLVSTLDFLDAKGYPHVGTAHSREERDRLVIVERNGIKVAFLSYTYGLNDHALEEGKDYLVNIVKLNTRGVDVRPIKEEAARARAAGADAVVAFLHWSFEYQAFPTEELMRVGRDIVEGGVDVVIGNHAHHIQPVECHSYVDPSSGEQKRGLIFYALGDLVSCNEHVFNTRLGNLAKFRISKGEAGGTSCTRITSLAIRPFYGYREMSGEHCSDLRLLDLDRLAKELRSGKHPLGISTEEGKKILKLDKLGRRILGPAARAKRDQPALAATPDAAKPRRIT